MEFNSDTSNDLHINLQLLTVPDKRSFHGTVIPWNDKYICVYHNSETHRLASCFIEKDTPSTFRCIETTHTENLSISYYMDPRIMKYEEDYYISVGTINYGPDTITLFKLKIEESGITIDHTSNLVFHTIIDWPGYRKSLEKNWTPWTHEGKFLYTYSLNPHRILELDIKGSRHVKLIASTTWKSSSWWSIESFAEPRYRLNCPPILLPDGSYLSVFHTMKMQELRTPWHKITPNNLRSYYMGFFQFEGTHPFKVVKISKLPFITPFYNLPSYWPFHPPPSGGNPFYPFSMILDSDNVHLFGGSNEIAIAYCTIPLLDILNSLCPVESP